MQFEYLKDGKIVSLHQAKNTRQFKAIAFIESYWSSLRAARLTPKRSDLDPKALAPHLAQAFILEQIAPGLARIRLAGQHLNNLMNMEVRGMPLTAFFLPEARAEMQTALEALFETPAKITVSLRLKGGAFQPPLDAQMTILPLKDNDGRVAQALGALEVKGEIGRGPLRFSIQSLNVEPLLCDDSFPPQHASVPDAEEAVFDRDWSQDTNTGTVTRVDLRPTASKSKPYSEGHVFDERKQKHAFAEDQTPYDMRGPSKRSHLRLIKND